MVRVTVIGSGDAFNSGGRGHSAYLVEAPGLTFLLECGPTALQGLKAIGRPTADLDFVLLSHLHGDHFGGLPFLFLEYRYESPRTRPLPIYGPPKTERRVAALFKALYEQVAAEPSPFPVHFTELKPKPAEIGPLKVVPFVVPHARELVCYGYRLEVADRVIAYSGDASWTDDFVTQVRGADLFICECSTYDTRLDIHLAYPEIAARAHDLDCRRLVLSHLGSEPLAHLSELTLECARDGMRIDL